MRILIVDDEAPLRQSLSLLLAESGHLAEAAEKLTGAVGGFRLS